MNTLIGQEIETRISLETFFKINKFNYIIEEIEKDDNIEIFECSMCTYFGFLSQLQCNNCNKRGCNTDSSTRFCFCKKSPTNLSGIMEGKVSFVSFTEWFVFGEVV